MGRARALITPVVIFVVFSLGAVACSALGQPTRTPTPSATPEATSTTVAVATPSPVPTATPSLPQAIVAVEPKGQQKVRSPLRVAGHARVYEGTVRYELVDAKGDVLGEGFTTATAGAPEVGYFSAEITYTPPAAEEAGTVRIYGDDPRDGKRVGVVEVPVILAGKDGAAPSAPAAPAKPTIGPMPTATVPRMLNLKVYFAKTSQTEVQVVEVTRTRPFTNAMARAALEELLKGPTPQEQQAGIQTSIPAGVAIKGLKIENGVAYAEFDQKLQEGVGGSVRVATIRKQITLTLQQFSTVQAVVISIDGRTEDILQP